MEITQLCDRMALMGSGEYVEQNLAMCEKWAWELHATDPIRFSSDIGATLGKIEILSTPITARTWMTGRVPYRDLINLKAAVNLSKDVYTGIKAGLDMGNLQGGDSNDARSDLADITRQYKAMGERRKWLPLLRTFDQLGLSLKALLHEAKHCQVGTFPQKAFL